MIDVVFEPSPWERALDALAPGDTLPAAQALLLMEEMSEAEAEDALLALEEKAIRLDITGLPADSGKGEAAQRLRREQQLVKKGELLENLDENDPLGMYLREIAQIPAAGDAQLLAERYAAGDGNVLQNLTSLYLGLAVEKASQMTGHGILLLDLIQEASLGLWQGALRYTAGNFDEHIRWWIDQYLAKAVLLQARASGIGERLRTAMEDYRDMDRQLLDQLGRNPTPEEIAEAIHITPEEAMAIEGMLAQVELRRRVDEARQPKEPTPDDEQAVENTALFQSRQRVTELLSTLTEQEKKLLALRFGLDGGQPKTPQQVGEILGITARQVVNMETAVMHKLRQLEQ